MPKRDCHLTNEQRCQIHAFLQAGICRTQIARLLGVTRSTITREPQRNGATATIASNRPIIRRLTGLKRNVLAAVQPDMHPDAGDIAKGDDGAPFKMAAKGVVPARLSHESNTRG